MLSTSIGCPKMLPNWLSAGLANPLSSAAVPPNPRRSTDGYARPDEPASETCTAETAAGKTHSAPAEASAAHAHSAPAEASAAHAHPAAAEVAPASKSAASVNCAGNGQCPHEGNSGQRDHRLAEHDASSYAEHEHSRYYNAPCRKKEHGRTAK
jgi:hypothetical protein